MDLTEEVNNVQVAQAPTDPRLRVKDTCYTGRLLKIAEVAHILHVTDLTVRRWIEAGAMEAVKLPVIGTRRHYRVPGYAVDKLLHDDTPASA